MELSHKFFSSLRPTPTEASIHHPTPLRARGIPGFFSWYTFLSPTPDQASDCCARASKKLGRNLPFRPAAYDDTLSETDLVFCLSPSLAFLPLSWLCSVVPDGHFWPSRKTGIGIGPLLRGFLFEDSPATLTISLSLSLCDPLSLSRSFSLSLCLSLSSSSGE